MGLQQKNVHLADQLPQPEEVIFIDDLNDQKSVGLKAVVVIDNTTLGPALGGVRMVADGSVEECHRLAHAMTLKNAAAGLRYGGGKAIIFADAAASVERKAELMRAFAKAIGPITNYIPGPDMGTNEDLMAIIKQTTGRAIGLPRHEGGIPLDEIGITGFGLKTSIAVALEHLGLKMKGMRFVVQGFGSVGAHVARFLADEGAIMVGVSDISGARIDQNGIGVHRLIEHTSHGGFVGDYFEGHAACSDALVETPCDVWIPAARPDVFNANNAGSVQAKIIAEGANIPATEAAEEIFHQRGILVLPDFIANAGGVICGAVEYEGGDEASAMAQVERQIRSNSQAVLERVASRGLRPRAAALELAFARLAGK